MKRWYIIFIVMIFVLSGCAKSYYVEPEYISSVYEEVSKAVSNGENIPLQIYDNSPNCSMSFYSTSDGRKIYYTYSNDAATLDINNSTYEPMCSIIGCDHLDRSCEYSFQKTCPRQYGDGFYFINEEKLYYRDKEGNSRLIFINDFSTEWSKQYYAECPEMLCGMLFINDHEIMMAGCNFYIIYNIDTKETSTPIILPEGSFSSCCYMEGNIYASRYGYLYRTDLVTGETECVSEQIFNAQVVGERIWYAKLSEGMCSLYSNNAEFNDEKLEVADGQVDYYSQDGMVVYCESLRKQYYLRNKNGEDIKLFHTDDLVYSYENLPKIYQDGTGTDRRVEYVRLLYCGDDEVYFAAAYNVTRPRESGFWSAYYKVDINGNITEFSNCLQYVKE